MGGSAGSIQKGLSIVTSDSDASVLILSGPIATPEPDAKSVSDRALDVAMAKEIPLHEPAELVAMIRLLDSEGLKGILGFDLDFTVAPEDVRSKPLSLEFPVDQRGRSCPVDLMMRITSPDFEPSSQSKVVRIPPFADSQLCTFLLTPRQLGELRVNVELHTGDVALVSRMLKTRATTSDRLPPDVPRAILTIPLTVLVQSSRPHSQSDPAVESYERLVVSPSQDSTLRLRNVVSKSHVPDDNRVLLL